MLQHASLEVPPDRVRDCVAFWALLGFTEMAAPPKLGGRFTWVEREGTQIHLIPSDDPAPPATEGHVAVVAPDHAATVAALHAAGFETSPATDAWDAPRAFVRCPAGHLVEVMGRPPVPPFPAA
jgi:catechol 2,3-dioxygenase-like lactoylglutathione lyase family enzyme